MKKLLTLTILLIALSSIAQNPATPDQLYGELFHDVQMAQILPDGKTFVDCTPKRNPSLILADYEKLKATGIDLKKFVNDNFNLPPAPPQLNYIRQEKDVLAHIKNLWATLERKPTKALTGSSLLSLPHAYVVPGGRFREMYYWDSYFTMLGLKESGRTDLIESMVKNFAWLINKYGHIPNGTRTYYLTRAQPPFFALMVDLLASLKGNAVYQTYLPAIEKEYLFFMEGDLTVKPGDARRRVVRMPDGALLNRYWDDSPTPRQESYREDVITADSMVQQRMAVVRFRDKASATKARNAYMAEAYTHIRAAAESGIDFSTRWFADEQSMLSIETTNIIPVDLNSLLYHQEITIAKAYGLKGNKKLQTLYKKWADERLNAINKYCYNDATGFYYDYHFVKAAQQTIVTPAGMYPFCFFPVDAMKSRAEKAAILIKKTLLKEGGIVTTTNNSGQQWDAPNGWAPLNWMTIWGFDRCGQAELAKDIAQRWCRLNAAVYNRTGKLLEKYNVMDIHLESGGGEYPTQDGFGWTNGVLLALCKKYNFVLL